MMTIHAILGRQTLTPVHDVRGIPKTLTSNQLKYLYTQTHLPARTYHGNDETSYARQIPIYLATGGGALLGE